MNLIPPKHLSVVSVATAALIVSIAGLPRVSSSYAQIQEDSSRQSSPSDRPTPVPASLQVTVLYPADGTIFPGKPQVVRANVIIGSPHAVSPHKYRVVVRLSNAGGDLVRSHSYHPAGTQSVGLISMLRLPPGDYTFSTELQYAGTPVAESGSSMIKKIGRTTPKGSTTPTPTPTATPTGATPVPGYATTWAGNTYGGRNSSGTASFADWGPTYPYGLFVQNQGWDLTVTPNGLSLIGNRWDEGHRFAGLYNSEGTVAGQLSANCIGANTAATAGLGPRAVTNNGTYIYVDVWTSVYWGATDQPTSSPSRANELQRYTITGAAAPFSGGGGNCGNQVIVDGASAAVAPVWGMAASSTEVFLADAATNQVKVYDANTMSYKRAFNVTNPRRIAYDQTGNNGNGALWVSTGTNIRPGQLFQGSIYHYDLNGNPLSGTITSATRPTGLTVNNGLLYVTDDGPDQQVKIYNNSGAQTGSFGAQGGYLSGTPGVITGTKLVRPNGVGFDGSGNMYVLQGANNLDDEQDTMLATGMDLRKYNSSGTLLWSVQSFPWCSTLVGDPASDGQDLYFATEHFKFNYSKLTTGSTGGGTEWSWYGHTLDHIDYPHDPRQYQSFTTATGFQDVGGNKYFATTDMYNHSLVLFKMVSDVAKPMTVFYDSGWSKGWYNAPAGSGYLWQDSNNDGEPQSGEFTTTGLFGGTVSWDFDANGDVWRVAGGSFVRLPMQGINGNGQLTYSFSSSVSYSPPSPFNRVEKTHYVAATDTMYISGYTPGLPYTSEPSVMAGDAAGTVLARYDNWAAGNRTAAWTLNLPHDPTGTFQTTIRSWAVGGDKIFATLFIPIGTPDNLGELAGQPSCGVWNNVCEQGAMAHTIYVYSTDGASLGEMFAGPESNFSTWQDLMQSVQALQRSNGEYAVFFEEQVNQQVKIFRGMLDNFTQY